MQAGRIKMENKHYQNLIEKAMLKYNKMIVDSVGTPEVQYASITIQK